MNEKLKKKSRKIFHPYLQVDLESGGLPSAAAFASLYQAGAQTGHKHGILHRLKPDTEGTITLVGYWEVYYNSTSLCTIS